MEQDDAGIERMLDELVEREGGFVDHPADRGGATRYGVTEAVARAHGYRGAMRHLPRDEAIDIYRRLYWLRPRFDAVAERAPRIAAELFDTGVNMGPAVAATFLQRALTALNRQGKDFADLVPDGRIGPRTLAALDGFLAVRGARGGETVLLRALEALQGERYLRLAERRPANEAFLYGWLANRIGTIERFFGRLSGDFDELKNIRKEHSMAIFEAIIAPLSKLIDKIIPDPEARDRAKLELIKLQGDQEAAVIAVQMQAIVAEAQSTDPWTSRARPSFLYMMYTLILWSIPMGLIAAVDPRMATGIVGGMTAYLRGIPEDLYALFGTGYLGYTAARTWGKMKGVDK